MNRGHSLKWTALGLGLSVLGLGIGGFSQAWAQAPGRGPAHGKGPGGPPPLHRGPVSYYMTSCASCHGPDGNALGPGFAAKLSETQLRNKVREMAEGMAAAPIDGPILSATTAFVRSIAKQEPYVAWINQAGPNLTGELSPGTKLVVSVRGKPLTATIRGLNWSVKLPAGAKPSEVVLTATRGRARHQVALSEGPHSFHPGHGRGGPRGPRGRR